MAAVMSYTSFLGFSPFLPSSLLPPPHKQKASGTVGMTEEGRKD
jgi:hypothetical protein